MFEHDVRPRIVQQPPMSDPSVGGWIGNLVLLLVVLLFVAVGIDKVSAAAEARWTGAGWYAGVAQLSAIGGLIAWLIVRRVVKAFRP